MPRTPQERSLISPEVQVMVDATRASTEQLARTNQLLTAISADATSIKEYIFSKDGLQKDLDKQHADCEKMLKEQISWLWLKIAAAMTVPMAILVALVQLIGKTPPNLP